MADENQSAVFNFVDDDTESCPVRRTLDLLQGKWNVYVIYELQSRFHPFWRTQAQNRKHYKQYADQHAEGVGRSGACSSGTV